MYNMFFVALITYVVLWSDSLRRYCRRLQFFQCVISLQNNSNCLQQRKKPCKQIETDLPKMPAQPLGATLDNEDCPRNDCLSKLINMSSCHQKAVKFLLTGRLVYACTNL